MRAARRGGLGLLLGARFGGLGQQFPGLGGDGGLDVAEVLVARLDEAADGAGQGDGQWGGRPGEGFGAGAARTRTTGGNHTGLGHAAHLTPLARAIKWDAHTAWHDFQMSLPRTRIRS